MRKALFWLGYAALLACLMVAACHVGAGDEMRHYERLPLPEEHA